MKKRWLGILFICAILAAQAEAATWGARAVGGTSIEEFKALVPTRDGGYFGAGESVYVQGFNFYFKSWIAKMDGTGNVKWNKVISGGWIDSLDVALELSDGNFIVAGGLGHSAYLAKLNPTGKILWEWKYPGSNSSAIYALLPATGGGFVAVGELYTSSFDAWFLKLDKDGRIVSQQTFGGAKSDYAYAIQPAAGGGYFISGSTDSYGAGGYDAWALKLDAAGKILWQQTFGGAKADFTHFSGLAATTDGGCVLAGSTESFGAGEEDGWVIRLDKAGKIKWQKAIGGKSDDTFYSIRQTSDKGFIVAGETSSFGAGKSDAWVLKLNAVGVVSWQYTHGGSASDGARSVLQVADGSYLAGGRTYSYGSGSGNGFILRIASSGMACSPVSRTSSAATKATAVAGKKSTAAFVASTVVPAAPAFTVTTPKASNTLICSR